MATNVIMPQLGESVVEGTVGRWLVAEGGPVKQDEPLLAGHHRQRSTPSFPRLPPASS